MSTDEAAIAWGWVSNIETCVGHFHRSGRPLLRSPMGRLGSARMSLKRGKRLPGLHMLWRDGNFRQRALYGIRASS